MDIPERILGGLRREPGTLRTGLEQSPPANPEESG